jgi:hypothetical protein
LTRLPHYLSVCAIYRDEAAYLREWVEFHKLVGVERFYLYDNSSVDESRSVLAPFESRGEVVVRDWAEFPGQIAAYEDCVRRHRDESRWIAFIDIDEFLFSPPGRPVAEVLREFEPFPGVGVNWANFGTSGHVAKPDGPVIANYLDRTINPRARRAIKSIVDPRRVASCESVHYFNYLDGPTVDENKRPIEGPDPAFTSSPSRKLLRINHYGPKSEEEYERKISRRRADTGERRSQRDPRRGDVRDEAILIYLPALQEALARPA